MTGTTIERLPADSNKARWSPAQTAYMAQLGLINRVNGRGVQQPDAPAGVVEMFIAQSQRTRLDPGNREIYCIERGGKWGVQISIDGFRLIAERTGTYEGQTTPEFSADGERWTTAWAADGPPAFARVGVYRKGWREPLVAVARYSAYVPMNDEWEGGRKTGRKVPSPMWAKMPDVMLAKVAEMLALRKAFPNDLSGLYGTEEMEQAGGTPAVSSPASGAAAGAPAASAQAEAPAPAADPNEEAAVVVADESWVKRAIDCTTLDEWRVLYREAGRGGHLAEVLESRETVGEMLASRGAALSQKPDEEAPAQPELPLDWEAMMLGAVDSRDLLDLRAQAERRGAWSDSVETAFAQRTEQLRAAQ